MIRMITILFAVSILMSCEKEETCTTCTTIEERLPQSPFATEWIEESRSTTNKCGEPDDVNSYVMRVEGTEYQGDYNRTRTTCN